MPDMYGTLGVVYGGLYAYPARPTPSPELFGMLGMPSTYRDPASISGLIGWFKASDFDGMADGTEVATWIDRSNRRSDATAYGTAGNRPLVARNSINTWMTSISHPGTGSIRGLGNAATVLTSQNTWAVFAVVLFTTAATEVSYFGWNTGVAGVQGGNDMRVGLLVTSGLFTFVYGNIGTINSFSNTPSLNAWHRVLIVNDANVESVYIDNSLVTLTGVPGTINLPQTGFSLLEGFTGVANTPLKGKLAEIAIFDSAPGAAERQVLDTYACLRFGL